MRLTQRRKDLLQRLVNAAKKVRTFSVAETVEDDLELGAAIVVFENIIANGGYLPEWDDPQGMKPIMCACGRSECYKGLHVGNDGELFIDLDVTYPKAGTVSFTLPS